MSILTPLKELFSSADMEGGEGRRGEKEASEEWIHVDELRQLQREWYDMSYRLSEIRDVRDGEAFDKYSEGQQNTYQVCGDELKELIDKSE